MLLTDEELAAIRSLPRDTPYQIRNVSHGQLSIARHYGGCEFNAAQYVYDPTDDTLTRDDVLKVVMRGRRKKPPAQRPTRRKCCSD